MTTESNRGAADRLAVASPMVGLVALWCAVLGANLWQIYNNNDGRAELNWAEYGWLVGIICLGAGSLLGKRFAEQAGESRLAKSGRGFTTVAVIVSLISGAIYGFAVFMMSFVNSNFMGQPVTLLQRMINVYIPVIVDAGFLVALILFAFVLKHREGDDD